MNYDFEYLFTNGEVHQMTMTCVLGHLTSSDFSAQYRKWNETPPVHLFDVPVITSTSQDMNDVANNLQIEARSSQMLLIWTDCDREGEHIGSEIVAVCKKSNSNIRVLRAKFSSVSERDVKNAIKFSNLVPLDFLQAKAVEARIELDLRIGAAFTRFQTLSLRDFLISKTSSANGLIISYGSCQFPTLGFVVDRYWKRENFIQQNFWKIEVELEKDNMKIVFNWRRRHLFDRLICFIIYELCCLPSPLATITKVESKPTRKLRPLPLTTVEMQKIGSRLLGISSDRIMIIAEDLYNKGFISYPRTETDQFDEATSPLTDLIGQQTVDYNWGSYARNLLNGKFKWPRKGKNNDKAHPPIHPISHTNQLEGDYKRVYEFIVKRFLACCSEDALGQETLVEIEIGKVRECFSSKGLEVIEKNFLDIYPFDKWNDSIMPRFVQGQTLMPCRCEMVEGKTTPPNLLTESELIAVMDKNGIGTDATIAEHIKKVLDRGYVFKQGIYFCPSSLGLALVEGYDNIGFDKSLAKPMLRSLMENLMKDICNGNKTKESVVSQSIDMYKNMFVKANNESSKLLAAISKYVDKENIILPSNREPFDNRIPQSEGNSRTTTASSSRGTSRGRGRGRGRQRRPKASAND